ncbi:MAG: ATP-dependent RecD-like DNA helicase [Haliscomenobacter sp.]|nr:ATP-dependent RecD-like DNA helicase [Haliscomenobacter sp.]
MLLTPHQKDAFAAIQSFLKSPDERVFVLQGYAGTGKTTLVGNVVRWAQHRDWHPVLLATTGRAAKVLHNKTGFPASTIHSAIYLFRRIDDGRKDDEPEEEWTHDTGQLSLEFGLRSNNALPDNLLYIVDEASMIAHEPARGQHTARFGSGNLLDDFLQYTRKHKVIFVGDPCQLPPVSENPFSGALSPPFLRERFRLKVQSFELQEILRQNKNSEILFIAGKFRRGFLREDYEKWPKIPVPMGRSAHVVPDEDALVEGYIQTMKGGDYAAAMMIGQANNQVYQLNTRIRQRLFPGQALQAGEMLMVVQNSYHVSLANGDQVVVEKVRDNVRYFPGFTFMEVTVRALHDNEEYQTLLLKELLYNDQPSLGAEDARRLLIDFDQRVRRQGISRKSDLYRHLMMSDPYLNALRAKFGYAVTAHKAQGGEWPQVFLHIRKSLFGLPRPELYRWYYTALTRAQEHLYFNDGWWVQGYSEWSSRTI